ncbi:MAG: YegS/Rv2252/BmrU family lipid kinase [Bacteroidales bacterium]
MDKFKVLAIVNPIAGGGSKVELPGMLRSKIDDKLFDLEIVYTEYAGHATEITNRATAEGYYAVIAVGGDGTINEVAAALRDTQTALGIIPCGSGNGLARHLDIPIDYLGAIDIVNRNIVKELDYCTVNNRPFFCTCGVGFDAHVSEKFAKSKKRGAFTYLQKALVEYLRYRNMEYTLIVDNRVITEKAFLIACGNASQYGNNAFITPNANMHDGEIDVTVLLPFTPLDTALLGLLLFTKHIDQNTNINSFRAKELTIKRPKAGVMHIDGEPVIMDADLDIKCHHRGIKIMVAEHERTEKSLLKPIENNFWEVIKLVRKELNL